MTMTPEEKLAMARECQKEAYRMAQDDVTTFRDYGVQSALLAIDRMQERVRAETERCARIAEDELTKCKTRTWGWYICHHIAAAIRETQHAEG